MASQEGWEALERARAERTPVQARVTALGDAGAQVDVGGIDGTVPFEDLPFRPGATAADLVGERIRGVVVTAVPAERLLVVSPRALAHTRCTAHREQLRRIRGRVVARGEHGTLVDLGGLRGWVTAAAPSRDRRPTFARRVGGWITALTPYVAFVSAAPPAPGAGALSGVLEGTVVDVDRHAARVRLTGTATKAALAILPRDEIAWHPVPSAALEVRVGERVRGRVIALGLEGPTLSLRAATPSPWPAIALELPPGTEIRARVRAVAEDGAVARLVEQPHVTAFVPRTDVEPGQVLAAVVGEVDSRAGRLVLDRVRPDG